MKNLLTILLILFVFSSCEKYGYLDKPENENANSDQHIVKFVFYTTHYQRDNLDSTNNVYLDSANWEIFIYNVEFDRITKTHEYIVKDTTLLQLKDSVWRPNYYSPTPHADSLNSLIDSVKMIDNKIIINDRFHIFELSEGKYKVYIDRGRTSDDYKECKTNIEIINSPKNKKPEYVLRYLPDLYCWSQLSNDPSLEPILIDTVKIYDVDQIIPILVNI